MARYLDMYLNEHGTIEATTYVQLLERCRFLREFLATPEELAEIMNDLSV